MDPSQQQEGYAGSGYGAYYAAGYNPQGQGHGGQQAPDASAYGNYDQNAYQATYFGSGAQYGNGPESYDPAAATTAYHGTATGYGQVDPGDAYAQSFAEYEREAKDRSSSGGHGDRSVGRDFRSGGAGGGSGGGYERGGDRSGGRDYRGGDNRQGRFSDHQKSSGGAGVADVETDQDTIYVTGLGEKVTEEAIIERFGSIGRVKFDKKKGGPKVWIYMDKATGKPKGDGTITYEDPNAAAAAVKWFDNQEFQGSLLRVQLAEKKEPSGGTWGGGGSRGGRGGGRGGDYGGGRGDFGGGRGERPREDFGARGGGSFGGGEGRGAPSAAAAPGAGRGAPPGREGDWICPGCSNTNFAKRTECNRCQAAKPGGGRGAFGARGGGPASDGGRGGFQAGVGDWACPSCGNVNFSRRSTCNRCSTAKPGATFGGDAGGPPRRSATAEYGKGDSRGGDYGRGGDDRRDRDSRYRDDDRGSDRRREDRGGSGRDPGGRQDSNRGDDRRSRRDDTARPY